MTTRQAHIDRFDIDHGTNNAPPPRQIGVQQVGTAYRARRCAATWVDWWRSVCLNAKRIKPSSPARNSARWRSIGRCDCFARELRDYCEYRLSLRRRRRRGRSACRIVLDTRKKPGGIHNTVARARIPLRGAPVPAAYRTKRATTSEGARESAFRSNARVAQW